MESACKRPSYVSSKMPLTSTASIAAYEKAFLICGVLLQGEYNWFSFSDGGRGMCGAICESEIYAAGGMF